MSLRLTKWERVFLFLFTLTFLAYLVWVWLVLDSFSNARLDNPVPVTLGEIFYEKVQHVISWPFAQAPFGFIFHNPLFGGLLGWIPYVLNGVLWGLVLILLRRGFRHLVLA